MRFIVKRGECVPKRTCMYTHSYKIMQISNSTPLEGGGADVLRFVFFSWFVYSGGSSVGQNKLLHLILGYIYIIKYLQSNFIS